MKLFRNLIILLLIPILCNANQSDTLTVRLNNGGKLTGIITYSDDQSIIFNNEKIGETEIFWNEISFISSKVVYDSLQGEKSFIVLPAPIVKKESFSENFSAEFMMGKGFNYERYIGFGIRANLLLSNIISLGVSTIYHFGFDDPSVKDGYGALFLLGPELGVSLKTKNIIVEPTFSIGEGTYQVNNEIIANYYEREIIYPDASSKSDIYFSPGLALKIRHNEMQIGLRFQYILMNNKNTFGLYLTFGK